MTRSCITSVLLLASAVLALSSTGCIVSEVEVDELVTITDANGAELYSLDGYQSWYSIEVTGIAPGHGDSFRRIFANDTARSYSHFGKYPVGSILVKDIFELEGESGEGPFEYTAIMRKVAPEDAEAADVELEGGWVFTFTDPARDDEGREYTAYVCYDACHVQGPIDYAWYDYGL